MNVERFILVSVLLTGICPPCSSQTKQASVTVGGRDISLGMPVDRALVVVREAGKVEPVAEMPVHRWIVYNRQNEVIASVTAEGNVIASVGFLVLGHSLNSSQDMFDAIFAAALKVKALSRDTQSCEITTSSDYGPNSVSGAAVHFYCGRSSDAPLGTYRIELRRSVAKGDGGPFLEVWGEIGAWPSSVP